jgi:hypothetical protein
VHFIVNGTRRRKKKKDEESERTGATKLRSTAMGEGEREKGSGAELGERSRNGKRRLGKEAKKKLRKRSVVNNATVSPPPLLPSDPERGRRAESLASLALLPDVQVFVRKYSYSTRARDGCDSNGIEQR